MNFRKITAAVLIASSMLSLSSCGLISVSRIDGVPKQDGSDYSAADRPPIEVEAYVPTDAWTSGRERAENDIKSIGEYNFNGEIAFVDTPVEAGFFPEECAELQDRLAVERNALVEQLIGVKLVARYRTADEIFEWTKREKNAGEVIADVLVIPSQSAARYAAEKTLADLSKTPIFAKEYPFIDAESAKGSSITGAIYGVSGDACYSADGYSAVFFGKSALADAGVEPDSLYSCVKSGEWTWDKLIEYAEITGTPITATVGQQTLLDTIFTTSGGSYLKKDGALPSVGFNTESLSRIYSIFVKLNNAGIKTSSYTAADDFIGGETAFVIHRLSALGKIANSSADFGILPLPKTEADGNYLSPAPRGAMMFAVPKEAADLTKSSAVILALNAAQGGVFHDRFVDGAFSDCLRDEQSADMLDLILTTARTDAAYSLGAVYPEVAAATYDFVYKNRNADEKTLSKQVSSAGESMKKALEKAKKAIDKVK